MTENDDAAAARNGAVSGAGHRDAGSHRGPSQLEPGAGPIQARLRPTDHAGDASYTVPAVGPLLVFTFGAGPGEPAAGPTAAGEPDPAAAAPEPTGGPVAGPAAP